MSISEKLDREYATRHVNEKTEIEYFKLTWNVYEMMPKYASWYEGNPISSWDTISQRVTNYFLDKIEIYEKATRPRVEATIDTNQRLIEYGCHLINNETPPHIDDIFSINKY